MGNMKGLPTWQLVNKPLALSSASDLITISKEIQSDLLLLHVTSYAAKESLRDHSTDKNECQISFKIRLIILNTLNYVVPDIQKYLTITLEI